MFGGTSRTFTYLKEHLEFFTLTKFCKHTEAILFTILKVFRTIVLIQNEIKVKKSFKFAAATLWNSLPNHFRTENSFSHFKSLIQSWSGSKLRCSACTFVLAAFHLLLRFVAIGLLITKCITNLKHT
jgi:hypothetical protein